MASYSISVQRNDGSSALFDLHNNKTTIGQHHGEIATLDPMVADPHGELHFDGRTLTYVDTGSPAGSFLPTGERVTAPMTLQPGTTICFGGCRLMVQDIRPDMAAPMPAAPMAAPMPAAPMAAPMPAAPQAPANPMQGAAPAYGAPVAAPAQAAPAPAYGLPGAAPAAPSAADAGDPPAGAGLVDQLMHHLRVAVERYKKHYLSGILTVGLIAIPAALINALLGWIPVLGFIVAIIVGLAQLAIVPIAVGALGRWALSTAAGKELSWKQAWKAALKDPVQEWLNVFVAQLFTILGFICLIVPGLIVGMFALPAYLLEGKKFVAISSRSAELVMKDFGGIVGFGFLTILALVPAAMIVGIVVTIVGLLPVVGEPMAAFLGVALNVTVAPFLYLLWAQFYYATVRRLEAVDPVTTHAATIESWSGASAQTAAPAQF